MHFTSFPRTHTIKQWFGADHILIAFSRSTSSVSLLPKCGGAGTFSPSWDCWYVLSVQQHNPKKPRGSGGFHIIFPWLFWCELGFGWPQSAFFEDTQGNADVHQELLRSRTSAHRQRRSQSQKELQIPLRVFSPSTELPTMSFNGTTYTSLLLFTKLAVGHSHSVSQLVMVASSKGTRASSFDIDSLSTFTVNIFSMVNMCMILLRAYARVRSSVVP